MRDPSQCACTAHAHPYTRAGISPRVHPKSGAQPPMKSSQRSTPPPHTHTTPPPNRPVHAPRKPQASHYKTQATTRRAAHTCTHPRPNIGCHASRASRPWRQLAGLPAYMPRPGKAHRYHWPETRGSQSKSLVWMCTGNPSGAQSREVQRDDSAPSIAVLARRVKQRSSVIK